MGESTTRFFEDLDRRGYEPLLDKAKGRLRFDLREGAQTTHWLLAIDRGNVSVTQEDRESDTIVTTSPQLFDEITAGREDAVAAGLRGDLTIAGDLHLMVQVERTFPGRPDAHDPRRGPYREVVR